MRHQPIVADNGTRRTRYRVSFEALSSQNQQRPVYSRVQSSISSCELGPCYAETSYITSETADCGHRCDLPRKDICRNAMEDGCEDVFSSLASTTSTSGARALTHGPDPPRKIPFGQLHFCLCGLHSVYTYLADEDEYSTRRCASKTHPSVQIRASKSRIAPSRTETPRVARRTPNYVFVQCASV